MCSQTKELGNIVTVMPQDQVDGVCEKYLKDLEDLVRSKTGREVVRKKDADGHFYMELEEGRAFGRLPDWCKRSIDRADPRNVLMAFETRRVVVKNEQHEDVEETELKIRLFERLV